MSNCGLPEEEAKRIETNYHTMYAVSDAWVADKLELAAKNGYVTVAFGLRLRTPLLSQVLWNSKKTPYEAKAEGRTAGNALGQSYGMLNNRSGIAFQEKTLASSYRYDILPCAQIHDAGYYLIRNQAQIVEWANTHLIQEMEWQELPEIQHPEVGLGGELDLFFPDWSVAHTLPNNATAQEIVDLCQPPKEDAA